MKIKIPDNWNEITIGQYQEILQLDKEAKDYSLLLTSIVIDQDTDIIKTWDIDSMNRIVSHLGWLNVAPSRNEYKQLIEIDGESYVLNENIKRFSGGQWWDMEEYMLDSNTNMHYLFAMLYMDKYEAGECKKLGELFAEKVMIGDVYGALVFFSTVVNKSMISIPEYLLKESLMISRTLKMTSV